MPDRSPMPDVPPSQPERRKKARFYRCVACGGCVVTIARPTACERCPGKLFDDIRH